MKARTKGLWEGPTKIRKRLGGSEPRLAPFPPKPKGMWQKTYESLQEQYERHNRAAIHFIEQRFHLERSGPKD